MADIPGNIRSLLQQIPDHVKIVAVSKTMPPAAVMKAYKSGQRVFGENRVQELLSKRETLPGDIEWHMIGHLQSKKVRQVVPHVALIQSVDSHKLVSVINREAEKAGVVANILLQFHIAEEESKSGFVLGDAKIMIESPEFNDYRNISIRGVMGMATFTPDEDVVRAEFRRLAGIFRFLKDRYFDDNQLFSVISMGMSGDYRIAIEEGSTMIRVGSLIFGERS